MFTYEVIGVSQAEGVITVLYSSGDIHIGRKVGYVVGEDVETTKARILSAAPSESLTATPIEDNISGLSDEFDGTDIENAKIELTPVETKERLLKRVSDKRTIQERLGVTINGTYFYTDESSLIRLLGAVIESIIDPAYSLTWKTPTGPISIDGQTLIGIATLIRQYTQSCFDREAAIIATVLDDTFEESDLDEGWPSNEITTG